MEKNKISIILSFIAIIIAIISLALALFEVDIRIVCFGIFLTLCFVALSLMFNKKDDNK